MTSIPTCPLLPCVDPNDAAPIAAGALRAEPFSYVGQGLTLDAFRAYVAAYDFGTVPPDQIVIHHTVNPDASWAARSELSPTWWDRDERDMSAGAIYAKRRSQLDTIRDYYASIGWLAGPHLFVDDRYLWLFTPMAAVGVHAAEGNSYHDARGHLHYSIGIEVVGYYDHIGWPPAIQALLRGAVQVLRDRLRTFQIVYHAAPPHQPAAHRGSIAFHRDYNKPACPGAFITPDYALTRLAATDDSLRSQQLPGPPDQRDYVCSAQLADFYAARGGLGLFGYALSDETRDGADTYMRWERAIGKTSARYGAELALLPEAIDRGWLP